MRGGFCIWSDCLPGGRVRWVQALPIGSPLGASHAMPARHSRRWVQALPSRVGVTLMQQLVSLQHAWVLAAHMAGRGGRACPRRPRSGNVWPAPLSPASHPSRPAAVVWQRLGDTASAGPAMPATRGPLQARRYRTMPRPSRPIPRIPRLNGSGTATVDALTLPAKDAV